MLARAGLEAHVQLAATRKLFSPAPWHCGLPLSCAERPAEFGATAPISDTMNHSKGTKESVASTQRPKTSDAPGTWSTYSAESNGLKAVAEGHAVVDAFDVGAPGTYATGIDRGAVVLGVRTALALGCAVNTRSSLDRKHYAAADLPAGYQITQHRVPLAADGLVSLGGRESLRIARVHLEQDAARTLADGTLDYTRCGAPLAEVVTDTMSAPLADHTDADALACRLAEAARRIATVLTDAGVTPGVLAHGNVRFDANVSLGGGPRFEIKNVASFAALRTAVRALLVAQMDIYRDEGALARAECIPCAHLGETDSLKAKGGVAMAVDKRSGRAVATRPKESAAEYMYIPEADVPAVVVDARVCADALAGMHAAPLYAARRLRIDIAQARILAAHGLLALCDALSEANHLAAAVPFLANDYAAMLARGAVPCDAPRLHRAMVRLSRGEICAREARLIVGGAMDVEGAFADGPFVLTDEEMALVLEKKRRGINALVGAVLERRPRGSCDPLAVRRAIANLFESK